LTVCVPPLRSTRTPAGYTTCMGRDSDGAPEVYTIGHSNHPLEHFLYLLDDTEIEVVLDVRSTPYSRYAPHFKRGTLEDSLAHDGIEYIYMGDVLGGRPKDPAFQSEKGGIDYEKLAASPRFIEGIEKLVALVASTGGRVAVMCAEEDPARCHRTRLLAPALRERGVRIWHIRGTGSVVPDQEPETGAEQQPLL